MDAINPTYLIQIPYINPEPRVLFVLIGLKASKNVLRQAL